jgi:DNA-binding transcriptional LysR family regulator
LYSRNIFTNDMSSTESLKGIAPFVYAADSGSFASAAERLNLTSSAVSKSVARLEERLGVRLFERTTRSLALTDAGSAFYETCVRILRELAEAEAILAAQKLDPMGRIRIDLPATFGRLAVLPIVTRLCEHYPNLLPHVTFTDRFVDIVEEGVDVAVRIGAMSEWPASVAHHYVGNERLVFCASPGYLARRGLPTTTDALVEHDCICYGRPDGTVSSWTFASEGGSVVKRAVPYRLVFGDAQAQLAAVEAGLGIAQLATWLADDRLRTGRLVEVLADFATDGLPLFLIWQRARQLTPKVAAVVEMLRASLAVR